jgi:hypothetical protein
MTTKVYLQTPIKQYIKQVEQLLSMAYMDQQPTEFLDNQLHELYLHRDLGLNWVEMPVGV